MKKILKHQASVVSPLYNRGGHCPLHEHNPALDLLKMENEGDCSEYTTINKKFQQQEDSRSLFLSIALSLYLFFHLWLQISPGGSNS